MSTTSAAFDELQLFDNQLSNGQMYILVSHRDENEAYRSRKISLDNLAAQLSESLTYIRSAARTPSSDFATVNHDHDIYTSATYQNSINGGTKVIQMRDSRNTYVMSISASDPLEPSEYPDVYQMMKPYLPHLGTVQMVGVRDLALHAGKFDMTKPEFTGWVHANGSSYSINDFYMSADMSKVFKTSGSSFTVPVLYDFPKINCSTSSGNTSYVTNPGHAALPVHSHDISIPDDGIDMRLNSTSVTADQTQLNNTIKGILKSNYNTPSFTLKQDGSSITMRSGHGYTKFAHYGKNDSNNFGLILQSKMPLDDQVFSDFGLIAEQGNDSEIPYPSHNLVPAVIYVGPSKYSDLLAYLQ